MYVAPELLVAHLVQLAFAEVVDLAGVDLGDLHGRALHVSLLPIGDGWGRHPEHRGDFVEPEPMASVCEAECEPHRLKRVFYRMGAVDLEVAVAFASPPGRALVAHAEAALRVSSRVPFVQICQNFIDCFF